MAGNETIAYDVATGDVDWEQSLPVGFYAHPVVRFAPDGATVFVAGSHYDPPQGWHYAVVALDASSGSTSWIANYQGPPSEDGDALTSMAVAPDGSRVYVTGSIAVGPWSEAYHEYGTIAYDAATGAQLWVQRTGRRNFWPSLAVSPEGSAVFVTGVTHGYVSIAYDAATGSPLWRQTYPTPRAGGAAHTAGLAVNPDGSALYVTGSAVNRSLTTAGVTTFAYRTAP